jgi:hypothetical protein
LFKQITVQSDCYVMKSILHDWDDKSCATILRNLRATMPAGSTLVNFDRLMPPCGSKGFHPAKVMDMNMMVSGTHPIVTAMRMNMKLCNPTAWDTTLVVAVASAPAASS